MNSISENVNSETFIWDDYTLAKEAIDQASTIETISIITSVVGCVFAIACTSPLIRTATMVHSLGTAILTLIISFLLRKEYYHPPFFSAVLLGFSIPWCKASMLPHLMRFGSPIFTAMCLYSAYLQTKGLTKRGFLELALDRLKEVISQDESKDCVLINKLTKKWNYTYLSINSNELQLSDLINVLIKAYESKKILNFSHLTEEHPTKSVFSHYSYLGNGTVIPIYKSVAMSPSEIFKQLKSNVWWYGCEKRILNSFHIAVDYLIACKKNYKDLDENYINEQLQNMAFSWIHNGDSLVSRLSPNIILKNGNPIIITRFGELGDYTPFKFELQKYFEQVTDVTEDIDTLF